MRSPKLCNRNKHPVPLANKHQQTHGAGLEPAGLIIGALKGTVALAGPAAYAQRLACLFGMKHE